MKKKETCKIVSQERIGSGIFSMWLECPAIAGEAKPGQFVSVYLRDRSRLLPRPISICETDKEKGWFRLVYRVTGKGTGTDELSGYHPGIRLEVTGPLGNGFPLQKVSGKKVLLVGGGIGVPPMLETAKALASLDGEKSGLAAVCGYRDELFLGPEFRKYADVFIATEDGSAGTKGTVIDAIRENQIQAEVIFACGPRPMLKAVKEFALERNILCWVSMEERMACGIGACLGCVCKTTETDPHSHVNNARVCKDGPVFLCTEVEL